MTRLGGRASGVILLLVVLAMLALGWVSWGRPIKSWVAERTKSDSTRVAEAAAAYDAHDWQRAADLTRSVLKSQADNLDALRLFARASARMGHDSTAGSIYMDKLGKDRLEAEDLFLLGLLHTRAGRLETALELWEKAARESDDAELLDNLARLSARLQKLDDAADAARRLSRKPSWEARGPAAARGDPGPARRFQGKRRMHFARAKPRPGRPRSTFSGGPLSEEACSRLASARSAGPKPAKLC